MIQIGIYSKDSNNKKEIKKLISQYFEDINIKSEINYIRTRMQSLNSLTVSYIVYNIVIICDENKATYIKRNIINHTENYNYQTVGWLNLPLCKERIDEIIYFRDDYRYQYGIFGSREAIY